tara:strand:+ start:1460 stop:1942 length:483 start_codon:yes stop_codon:yes gene_type:complete
MFLNENEFSNLIQNAPLISVDICILKNNYILIGKRKNNPAKDFYFVPGGRIRKNECIDAAVDRLLVNEIGYQFKNNKNKLKKSLGYYEHFYDDNFQDNSKFSTHYVVLPFIIQFEDIKKTKIVDSKKDQHSNYVWFEFKRDNLNNLKIHQYTSAYFEKFN